MRFVLDDEAIQHSKALAAQIRHRHYPNQRGLTITVLDQAGRKLHDEPIYSGDEQTT
jgi:hypothetical protein